MSHSRSSKYFVVYMCSMLLFLRIANIPFVHILPMNAPFVWYSTKKYVYAFFVVCLRMQILQICFATNHITYILPNLDSFFCVGKCKTVLIFDFV